MISIFSCFAKAPQGEMTYYHYREVNSYACRETEYTAELQPDGKCLITRKIGRMQKPDIHTATVDKSAMDSILAIFLEKEMYAYDKEYQPKFTITDGTSWSYSAKVGDKSFSSNGYQCWPDRAAFRAIDAYLDTFLPLQKEH